MFHPPSGLPELLTYECSIERANSGFLAKSRNFFCQLCPSRSTPILFSNAKSKDDCGDDPPDLLDEMDDDYSALLIDDLLHCSIGDKVAYSRDGVNEDGDLINIVLDPSRTQLLYTFRFKDNTILQTTHEFLKFTAEEDVADIPLTTDDYMSQCRNIDPEQLQRLMHPKSLSPRQEEWLQWHERLNHLPHAQMLKLAKRGILP